MKTKILKIGLPVFAAIALVVGLAIPAMAAPNKAKDNPNTIPNTLTGSVTTKTSDTFTIQTLSGNVTIKVDSNTQYFLLSGPLPHPLPMPIVPGQKAGLKAIPEKIKEGAEALAAKFQGSVDSWHRYGKSANFTDVTAGSIVYVKVMPNDNLAKEVLIVKAPKIQQVQGVITIGSNNTIIVTPTTGSPVTLTWNSNTRFVLRGILSVQNGYNVTARYNANDMIAREVLVNVTTSNVTAM